MSETPWLDIQGNLLWSTLELLLFRKRGQVKTRLEEALRRQQEAPRPPPLEEDNSLDLENWDIHLLRHIYPADSWIFDLILAGPAAWSWRLSLVPLRFSDCDPEDHWVFGLSGIIHPTPSRSQSRETWGFIRLPDWGSDDELLQLVRIDRDAVQDRVVLEREDFDDPELVQFISESGIQRPSSGAPSPTSSDGPLRYLSSLFASPPPTPTSPLRYLANLVASPPTSPTSPRPHPAATPPTSSDNVPRLFSALLASPPSPASFIRYLSSVVTSAPPSPTGSPPVYPTIPPPVPTTPPPRTPTGHTPSSPTSPLELLAGLFASSPSGSDTSRPTSLRPSDIFTSSLRGSTISPLSSLAETVALSPFASPPTTPTNPRRASPSGSPPTTPTNPRRASPSGSPPTTPTNPRRSSPSGSPQPGPGRSVRFAVPDSPSSSSSSSSISSSGDLRKDTTPPMPDPPGSPDKSQDVPLDKSPRGRFLLSFVRLVTSFVRHNGASLILDLNIRLPVCHTRHLDTIQPVFVELACHILDTGKVQLPEAARLVIDFEDDPNCEVIIDSVKMVEKIMSGPLGFALLGLILCASWGYTGHDAGEVALSHLDEIAKMVGEHLRVLFPGVKGWEGTESRKRWAGREGNPVAPWTKEIRTKTFGSYFNKCVSCRHNTGPFPMPQDGSWANWFESIAQRHDYHQARRGRYQPDPPPPTTEPQASSPGQPPPVPDSTKAEEFAAAWTPVWDDTFAILQKRRSLWTPTRAQSEKPESPIYIEIQKRRKRGITPAPVVVSRTPLLQHDVPEPAPVFVEEPPHAIPGSWPFPVVQRHLVDPTSYTLPPVAVGEPPITPDGMIPGSWSPRPVCPVRPPTRTQPPPSPDTVPVRITGPRPATNTGYTIALPETPPGGAPKASGGDAQFLQLSGTPRAPGAQTKPKTPEPGVGDGPPATPKTEWNRQHLNLDQRLALVKYLFGQVARRFPRGRAGVVFTGATASKKDGKGDGKTGGTGTGETNGTGGVGGTGPATVTKPAEVTKPGETTKPREATKPTDETQPTDQTKPADAPRPPDTTKTDAPTQNPTAPQQSSGQGMSSSLLKLLRLVTSAPSRGTGQPAEDHSEEARLRLCQQWDDWYKMPLPTTKEEWENPKHRPPDDVPSHRQETIPPNSESLII